MTKQGSVRVNYSGSVLPAIPHKNYPGDLLLCDGKKVILKSLHRDRAAVFNPGIRVGLFDEVTNRWW